VIREGIRHRILSSREEILRNLHHPGDAFATREPYEKMSGSGGKAQEVKEEKKILTAAERKEQLESLLAEHKVAAEEEEVALAKRTKAKLAEKRRKERAAAAVAAAALPAVGGGPVDEITDHVDSIIVDTDFADIVKRLSTAEESIKSLLASRSIKQTDLILNITDHHGAANATLQKQFITHLRFQDKFDSLKRDLRQDIDELKELRSARKRSTSPSPTLAGSASRQRKE